MVYIEPTALGHGPVIKSWMEKLNPIFRDIRKPLQLYFDTLLEPCIYFIRKYCSEPVPTVDNNLLRCLLNILDCVLAPFAAAAEQAALQQSAGVVEQKETKAADSAAVRSFVCHNLA